VILSVILPTRNPEPIRLRRTLQALGQQTLRTADWECLVVDNGSNPALQFSALTIDGPKNLRLIRELQPGLTSARRCGFQAGSSEIVVMVDDDNLLAPDYLAKVLAIFKTQPRVGALGGRSLPEFENEPAPWVREFEGLLACRDLGETPLLTEGLFNPVSGQNEYPVFAPIGAGMAVRRAAVESWLSEPSAELFPDRCGRELTSGGDNEMVLMAMEAGWEVGYFPELVLTHLIPDARLTRDYLACLNRSIQKSWVQVLQKHNANPWPRIPPWTVPLRQLKAWFVHRAWSSPSAHVRWQGVCGHFEGRAL